MAPTLPPRSVADNSQALYAFIAAMTEIDIMLERLQALSDDHFETLTDDGIHWDHISTLQRYRAFYARTPTAPSGKANTPPDAATCSESRPVRRRGLPP